MDRSRRSAVSLDEQLPADHPVRVVWDFVTRLDLSAFDRPTRAVVGHPGAPVVPATLLFALWLFAMIDGTVSARRLAQLCRRDLPFPWLCGGQPVNYHTLADFYADNASALQDLWVEHVAALRQHQLIPLHTVTLDGSKIPAASKDGARREGTLQRHLAEAREHLRRLQEFREQEAGQAPRRVAARRRGVRERVARLEQAVAVVRRRQQQRRDGKRTDTPPENARASETDPDPAKMKLPDGGYRLAYNVETVTDEASGLIVTVAVTDQGSDTGQASPLLRQLQQEQQARPQTVLLDSGFADADDIRQGASGGVLAGAGVQRALPPGARKGTGGDGARRVRNQGATGPTRPSQAAGQNDGYAPPGERHGGVASPYRFFHTP
jgi:transposase